MYFLNILTYLKSGMHHTVTEMRRQGVIVSLAASFLKVTYNKGMTHNL